MEIYNDNRSCMPRPKTWFAESILTLIFCCLPFGIIALVYASQVSSHYAAGRYAESEEASRNARKWVLAGLFTGIAVYVIYAIIYAIFGFSILALGTMA